MQVLAGSVTGVVVAFDDVGGPSQIFEAVELCPESLFAGAVDDDGVRVRELVPYPAAGNFEVAQVGAAPGVRKEHLVRVDDDLHGWSRVAGLGAAAQCPESIYAFREFAQRRVGVDAVQQRLVRDARPPLSVLDERVLHQSSHVFRAADERPGVYESVGRAVPCRRVVLAVALFSLPLKVKRLVPREDHCPFLDAEPVEPHFHAFQTAGQRDVVAVDGHHQSVRVLLRERSCVHVDEFELQPIRPHRMPGGPVSRAADVDDLDAVRPRRSHEAPVAAFRFVAGERDHVEGALVARGGDARALQAVDRAKIARLEEPRRFERGHRGGRFAVIQRHEAEEAPHGRRVLVESHRRPQVGERGSAEAEI
mmetsp:Transcript_13847/g.48202  ORF Transcript_13847/g.48202 Transcript_13847/m.48202 type:complete len:365 (+) Transcript_13847:28-1122(+)